MTGSDGAIDRWSMIRAAEGYTAIDHEEARDVPERSLDRLDRGARSGAPPWLGTRRRRDRCLPPELRARGGAGSTVAAKHHGDVNNPPRISREFFGTATSWLDSIRGTLNLPGAPNLFRDIEVLIMGVRGKELLWTSLERLRVITEPPLAELQARARDQIAGLEELHARCVAAEFRSGRG
jgi:hypothetical protein